MEIRRYQIPFTAQDPISWELFTESSIFFDIETTGFSQEYTQVYLIGCVVQLFLSRKILTPKCVPK